MLGGCGVEAMDDFADLLEEEQKNSNGLLMEILTSGYEHWDYLVAVEGVEDRLFYFDFVRDAVGSPKFQIIDCGGKEALFGFKQAVESYPWKDPPAFLYLCDKDFDDILDVKNPDVWYTEHYSIESYFAEDVYIEYAVSKNCSRPLKPAERISFIDAYRDTMQRLAADLRAYAAYMCEVRRRKEHPDFDKFAIDSLFALGAGFCMKKPRVLQRAREALEVASEIDVWDIVRLARTFSPSDWPRWLRGKLAVQLARKSYEIALKSMPRRVKERLPPTLRIDRETFGSGRLFLSELNELPAYCRMRSS